MSRAVVTDCMYSATPVSLCCSCRLAALVSSSASLRAEELTLDMFKGYAYLFIEGYLVQDHEMILHAIELAKEAGLQICLDLSLIHI